LIPSKSSCSTAGIPARVPDLDQEVGPVDEFPQPRRFLDRGVAIVGEVRRDFEAQEAVSAARLIIDLAQDVASIPHVSRDQLLVEARRRSA
jgi:hypothetical protein